MKADNTVHVTLAFDAKNRKVVLASQKEIDNLGGSAEKSARKIDLMERASRNWKKTLRTMTAAVMTFVSVMAMWQGAQAIVRTGAAFEQTMLTVQGVSGATATEYERMTAAAREMGRQTEWSASQAAEALQYLSMAGFSVSQSVKALPGVLDLATAGGLDLGRAADIASNALTAMRLGVEDLDRVNDVFIKTITTSNTNMFMMAESFKYAAPTAAAYGYTIEQLSAMIGLLGNAGIQGSMAGTQLSAAFTDVTKVFEYYKTKAGEGTKYTNDLIGALRLLEARGASAGEIMELFGERSGRAVNAILGQGVDALEKYIDKLNHAEGANAALAGTMRQSTANAFRELQSAMESVQIALFTESAGALNRTVRETADLVRDNEDAIVDFVNRGVVFIQRIKLEWLTLKAVIAETLSMVATALSDMYNMPGNLAERVGNYLSNNKITGKIVGEGFGKALREAAENSLDTMSWGNYGKIKEVLNIAHESAGDVSQKQTQDLLDATAAYNRTVRENTLSRMGRDAAKGVGPDSWLAFEEGRQAAYNRQLRMDLAAINNSAPGGSGGGARANQEAARAASERLDIQRRLTSDLERLTLSESEFELRELERRVAGYREKYGQMTELVRYEEAARADIMARKRMAEQEFAAEVAALNGDTTAKVLLEIERRKQAYIQSGIDRVEAEKWAQAAIKQAASGNKQISEEWQVVTNSMESAVVGFATNTQNTWANMIQNMYSELTRLMTHKVFMMFWDMLGGGGNGGSTGISFAGPLTWLGGLIFHDGGTVGATNSPMRRLPAWIFENAPRLHDGLKPDEFPAILQTGEEVRSRDGVKADRAEKSEQNALLREILGALQKGSNVNIYNVGPESPDEYLSGMAGEKKIVNIMRRNRASIYAG